MSMEDGSGDDDYGGVGVGSELVVRETLNSPREARSFQDRVWETCWP